MNLTTIAAREADLAAALKGNDAQAAAKAGYAYGEAAAALADRRHSIFEVTLNRPAPIPGIIAWTVYAEHVGDEDYRMADGTRLDWDSIKTTSRIGYPQLPEGARAAFDI